MTLFDIEILPGDSIIVSAPARHMSDDRPVDGVVIVTAVWPDHICGPCIGFRDEFGEGCIRVNRRDVVGAIITPRPSPRA